MTRLPTLVTCATLAFLVDAAGTAVRLAPRSGAPPASVTGTVFDGIERGVLAGATVQIVGVADPVQGRTFSTLSDSSGGFEFREIPPGRYVAGFYHPMLDTLGLESGNQEVDLHPGSQRLLLTSPTPRALIDRICPGGFREDTADRARPQHGDQCPADRRDGHGRVGGDHHQPAGRAAAQPRGGGGIAGRRVVRAVRGAE
jgi:hypothetical protein